MRKGRWNIPGLIVLLVASVAIGFPFARRAIVTNRFTGLWHVEGSFKDWRFDSDGKLVEDGLIDVTGHWKLAAGDTIEIDHGLGNWVTYRYRFDGGRLVLVGDAMSWGLTRK